MLLPGQRVRPAGLRHCRILAAMTGCTHSLYLLTVLTTDCTCVLHLLKVLNSLYSLTQGGECDLQDQAMAYGSDRSRYYEVQGTGCRITPSRSRVYTHVHVHTCAHVHTRAHTCTCSGQVGRRAQESTHTCTCTCARTHAHAQVKRCLVLLPTSYLLTLRSSGPSRTRTWAPSSRPR